MSLVNPVQIQFPPEMDNSTKHTRSIAAALVANTSTLLAPVNDNRTGMVLRNPGAFDAYLCLSDVAAAASAIAVIEPNGYYELSPTDYNGAVSVICPAGAGAIAGSEMASVAFALSGTSGTPYLIPNTTFTYRLNAGVVEFKDGNGAYGAVSGMSGVSSAYVLNGQIHALTGSDPQAPGAVLYAPVGTSAGQGSNAGNWASVLADSAKVAL